MKLMYIVVADDKEDGYFLLIKFDEVRNIFDDIVDKISKKDYPTKDEAKKCFRELYKIEI
jgi:hypothetical protein